MFFEDLIVGFSIVLRLRRLLGLGAEVGWGLVSCINLVYGVRIDVVRDVGSVELLQSVPDFLFAREL